MGLLISTNIIANNKKKHNKLVNSNNIFPLESDKKKDQNIIDNKQNKNNTNLENNNFILNDFDKILSYEHNDKT